MKKLRFLLVLTLAALLLAPAALADAIAVPLDLFIQTHDCTRLPRSYTANGGAGYVTLWDTPGSLIQKENVANGETLYCEYLFTDDAGETWAGVVKDYLTIRGWVKLSDCRVVYDYLSFAEDYGAEFTEYNPHLSPVGDIQGELVLWTYPGGSTVHSNGAPDDLENYISSCYTASDGSIWGYIGYIYGTRNVWVCVSDPDNGELPPIPGIPPAQAALTPPAEHIPAPTSLWLAGGLVAAVVAGTAVLISVLFRRKKQG